MSTKQVVLITGASSGFGRVMAEMFVREGYTVFGTSRHPQNIHISGVEMLPLDVQSDESVKACVTAVYKKAGRLDILINNAGYMLVGPAEETPVADMQAQFETNFFGTARMINAALPIMREQGNGRILIIGSLAGLIGVPFKSFYSASKHALEGYAESLRHELSLFNIHVSILEPGYGKTELDNAKHESALTDSVYARPFANFRADITNSVKNGLEPEEVAETALKAVRANSPRLRYRIGKEAIWTPRIKALVPIFMFDSGIRRRFGLMDE